MTLDLLHIVLGLIALAAAAAAFVFSQRKPPDTAHLAAELAERAKEVATLKAERDEQRGRAEKAEKSETGARASLEASEARAAEARAAASALNDQLSILRKEHAQAQAEAARTTEREASFAREKEQMQKMQIEAEARFKSLADAALLKSQQQFVQIADETLKKHQAGASGELGKMLKPIQESFGQFREKVDAIQKERAEDRASLSQQIKQVGESVRQTEMVAGKLATALSSTKGGGRWGEETLRNVLEMAGLSPYADFSEQTSTLTEKGRQRPDVIIRMPGGRELVIDAKVSLDDYLSGCEETEPTLRKQKFMAHAARVRNHVSGLSRKEYTKEFSERVDFVAMFIPGENFYAAVLEHDREIFDYAARNNVIIVTPSTLIALAKSVAYGWRQEQMAKNAEQAKKIGQELYERVAKFTEHMDRVGGGLGNAVKAYNDMVGSLESRVLPSARKLEELQFADPSKAIEDPTPVDLAPRQLSFLEQKPKSSPQLELVPPGDPPKRK
jgi:DNA recombination protein RmuC